MSNSSITRYWIKNTVVMQYSDDQWGHLWSLVNDATIREVFYQYLVTCVDTSVIRIGRAPMTAFKADAAAEQASRGSRQLSWNSQTAQPLCQHGWVMISSSAACGRMTRLR